MATKNLVCGQCGKGRHFISAKRCDECGAILPDQPGYVAPAAQPQPAPAPAPAQTAAPAPAAATPAPAAPAQQPAPQAQPAAHVCPACGTAQNRYDPDLWLCPRCDSAVINDIGATPASDAHQPAAPAPRPAQTAAPAPAAATPAPQAQAQQQSWLSKHWWKGCLVVIGAGVLGIIAILLIGSMLIGRVAPNVKIGSGGPTPAPTAIQQPTAQPTAPVIAGQPTAAPTMAPTAAPTIAAPGDSIIVDGVSYKPYTLNPSAGSQGTGAGAWIVSLPDGYSLNAHHFSLLAGDGSTSFFGGKDNQVNVLINTSGKTIKVLCPVGAGIDHATDLQSQVNARLLPGGGCSKDGCLAVSYAVIKTDGSLDTGLKSRN